MNGLLENGVIPLCTGLLLLSGALWVFQVAMG